MESYLIDGTYYVGSYSRNRLVNVFDALLSNAIEAFRKRGVDPSEALVGIAAIWRDEWMKYYIGFWSENLKLNNLINLAREVLAKTGLPVEGITTTPKIRRKKLNYVYLDLSEIGFIEFERKGIPEELTLLDSEVEALKLYRDILDLSTVGIIYWLDMYDKKLWLDTS